MADDIILNLRVVAKNRGNPKVTKVRIKTSPMTTVATLRQALAKEARKAPEQLSLTFNNLPMEDGRNLREHGIHGSVQIEVFLDDVPEPNLDTKMDENVNRKRGQKRSASENDAMSVSSKRTKLTNDDADKMTLVSTRDDVRFGDQNLAGDKNDENMEEDNFGEMQQMDAKDWPFLLPTSAQKHRKGPTVWNTNCEFYAETIKGGKRINEDNVGVFQNNSKMITAIGIFDGHGLSTFACTASKVSVKIMQHWFETFADEQHEWRDEQWKTGFERLFDKIHQMMREQFEKIESHHRAEHLIETKVPILDRKKIVRQADGNPIHGGTTATICVLVRPPGRGQYLVTAYVGDSEVILTKMGDVTMYELITCGHRALNANEYRRIQSLPDKDYPTKLEFVYDIYGVQDPSLLPRVFLPNGNINTMISQNPSNHGLYPSNIRKEPATYAVTPKSVRKDKVRLANTRSLGDFYSQQFGITHRPDICIEHLPTNQSFAIIAASDGVWDTWEYLEVVKGAQHILLQEDKSPQARQRYIKDFLQATKRGATELFRNELVVDDASIGIIHVPAEDDIPARPC